MESQRLEQEICRREELEQAPEAESDDVCCEGSRRMSILVIDDAKVVTDMLAAALSKEGYAVSTATSGAKASYHNNHRMGAEIDSGFCSGRVDGILTKPVKVGMLLASLEKSFIYN